MSRYKKTSTKNLYHQRTDGQFYLAAKIGGKVVWEALSTTVRSVAEHKLSERLRQLRRSVPAAEGGDWTFSQALDRLLEERKLRGLDEKTIADDEAMHARIKASFSQVELPVRKIDLGMLKTFFASLATKTGRPVSSSYFNRLLGRFREVFHRAEEDGLISANPAAKIKRRKNVYSPPTVITLADFHAVVQAMSARGGRSVQGAEMVEFMGYSGVRVNEARNVKWSDVSAEAIIVRHPKGQNQGAPAREVPIIPEMASLLDRLRDKRQGGGELVLRCGECYGSLKSACKDLGLPNLTHHDFRHFFATLCIKSGIDIATVAQILGHKDKGVTLLKTYAHICGQHVKEAVKKLNLSAPPPEPKLAVAPEPEAPKINPLAAKHGWTPPEEFAGRYVLTPHENLRRVSATGEYATVFTLRGRSFRKNLGTWDQGEALRRRDAYYQQVGKPVQRIAA